MPSKTKTKRQAVVGRRGALVRKLGERGMTLLEVMITLLIVGFFALISAQLAKQAQSVYLKTSDQIEAEESLLKAEYYLRRYFSYAVGDNALEDPADSTSLPKGITVITSGTAQMNQLYDSVNDAGENSLDQLNTDSSVDVIAYWVREEGNKAADGVSDFKRTALFYMRPSPTKSGVLFFDQGADSTLKADYSRLFVDRLVNFSVDALRQPSTQRLSALRFSITVRFFVGTDPVNYRWCSEKTKSQDSKCIPGDAPFNYKDITKEIVVTLRNHVIAQSSQNPTYVDPQDGKTKSNFERAFGSLYFFPPNIPESPF